MMREEPQPSVTTTLDAVDAIQARSVPGRNTPRRHSSPRVQYDTHDEHAASATRAVSSEQITANVSCSRLALGSW